MNDYEILATMSGPAGSVIRITPEGWRLGDEPIYLGGANLRGANLRGAYLSGAYLGGATMPGGETWEEYLSEVVPALLVAGGHPLAEVATERAWACHDWANCPMAGAFDAHSVDDVPLLHRPRAVEFIQFFDARLIPRPEA